MFTSVQVTLSAKSSLILGENKAAFCREGHIKKISFVNSHYTQTIQIEQKVSNTLRQK